VDGSALAEIAGMKTLLIRGDGGGIPPKVREIVRAGSTELKEIRIDEERDAATLEADRVVLWNGGEIELRLDAQSPPQRLRWPDEEEKLRMFFQTGG
jgi:hypothetical protein